MSDSKINWTEKVLDSFNKILKKDMCKKDRQQFIECLELNRNVGPYICVDYYLKFQKCLEFYKKIG